MFLKARITELEGQVTQLTTQNQTLTASVAQLTQANADCQTRFEADQVTITTLTTERDEARTNLATVTAERDGLNASIDAKVLERLSAAGVDPVQREPEASGSTASTAAEIRAAYSAIEDKDQRFAFYQKHKAVLLGA